MYVGVTAHVHANRGRVAKIDVSGLYLVLFCAFNLSSFYTWLPETHRDKGRLLLLLL
jgi:hypothetical protein